MKQKYVLTELGKEKLRINTWEVALKSGFSPPTLYSAKQGKPITFTTLYKLGIYFKTHWEGFDFAKKENGETIYYKKYDI